MPISAHGANPRRLEDVPVALEPCAHQAHPSSKLKPQ